MGGRPGVDCGGFCRYCYFRGVNWEEKRPFGCKNCPPGSLGCDYCGRSVWEDNGPFRPPGVVLQEAGMTLGFRREREATVSGGGDVSNYPWLRELVAGLRDLGVRRVQLGYTSGKGFEDPKEAEELCDLGVRSVSYTVFAWDPELRREWMGDRSPEASLACLEVFADRCEEVVVAAVLIPGVNDGDVLWETCERLEELGIDALLLMRLGTREEHGIILGNSPVLDVEPHPLDEFKRIVTEVHEEFPFRVTGTPLWDPETGAPFALRTLGEELRELLPPVEVECSLITGRVAAPLIREVFRYVEGGEKVDVVPVEKDVACLITEEDLKRLDVSSLRRTVVLPGRALVHDARAEELLKRDGFERVVLRGPDRLTLDGEASCEVDREEVLEFELDAFRELIDTVNVLGE
ncbi:methyl coenzyme M reductase-arginine methyltransferase Mmp10 [Methanopyrus sp.]